MATIGKDLDLAAKLLGEGELVAIPTETVYGLAANALNENAVLKIFEVKQRPFFDPLIIHLANREAISDYAILEDERLKKLSEKFLPGPLTLLLPKKNIIPDVVTSGLSQVGVRIPNNSLTKKILEKINFPLAAPSANPFGYVSPTSAQHVEKYLGEKIKYIVDGGECTIGIESTIVGIEENEVCVYRLGGVSVEDMENCVGKISVRLNLSGNPKTPGQIKNHYAPRKALLIGELEVLIKKFPSQKKSIITFGENHFNDSDCRSYYLSLKKDLNEAALNLFKFLRQCDEDESEIILCELLPEHGLGRAINDRLKRASAK